MADGPVIPVVLCGGAGTRLWPLSRECYPKPFLPLNGSPSLLIDTLDRLRAAGLREPPIVAASADHRFLVADHLARGDRSAELLLEPVRRDTAAALGACAWRALRRDPDAILFVAPADHAIRDIGGLAASLDQATALARHGHIIVFGITPSEPSNVYGYIRPGEMLSGHGPAARVAAFIEKPDAPRAARLIAEGCLWNSGMVVARADVLAVELEAHAPDIAGPARRAVEAAVEERDFTWLDPQAFASAEALSFDYAVLERTNRAAVLGARFGWSDIGAWSTAWAASAKDADGNAVHGDVVLEGVRSSYVWSQDRLTALVGVEDAIVVATRDAVLVTRRGSSGDVKALVERLKAAGRPEARHPAIVPKPWGAYEILGESEHFKVKVLVVKPGGALSLQTHRHRREHWVVLSGIALVTVGAEKQLLGEGGTAHIPVGAVHRLANPGETPLRLIEVQTGEWLSEDDIVRLEDVYGRT